MRQMPDLHRRLAWLSLQNDAVRGGLCAILMLALAVLGRPLWLTLILPFLAYAGLRLIASSMSQRSEGTDRARLTSDNHHEAYETCLRFQADIESLAGQVSDDTTSEQLRRVVSSIDRILGAIEEDKKYEASIPLLDLVHPTHDLLSGYAKIVRRERDDAETRSRIRESLATIETAYERFWVELNRDAIVDLEALCDTIDVDLKELTAPPKQIGLPSNPPEVVASEPVPAAATTPPGVPILSSVAPPTRGDQANGVYLTPREMQVLCLLAAGHSNQKIADELFISLATVKRHVTNLHEKLGVDSSRAAVAYAYKHALC